MAPPQRYHHPLLRGKERSSHHPTNSLKKWYYYHPDSRLDPFVAYVVVVEVLV